MRRSRPHPTPDVALAVIGAGLGRTGTQSLKLALERLLGAPVHHMSEVTQNLRQQLPLWEAAVAGAPYERWAPALTGYVGAVDWPACRWYEVLAARHPNAIVVLSHRGDADTWWRSIDRTVFDGMRNQHFPAGLQRLVERLVVEHIGSYTDESVAKAGYERHNAEVRARIPSDRLVEWQPGDGWLPLCAALGLTPPEEPFPESNSTAEFRRREGWD